MFASELIQRVLMPGSSQSLRYNCQRSESKCSFGRVSRGPSLIKTTPECIGSTALSIVSLIIRLSMRTFRATTVLSTHHGTSAMNSCGKAWLLATLTCCLLRKVWVPCSLPPLLKTSPRKRRLWRPYCETRWAESG